MTDVVSFGLQGPAGPGAPFVFRPGELAPSANVYADWTLLAAAVAKVSGFVDILIDGSKNAWAATIPAGTYALQPTATVRIRGVAYLNPTTYVRTTLTISAGVVFTGGLSSTCISEFANLLVVYQGAGGAIALSGSATEGCELTLRNANIQCTGTGALIQTTGAGSGVLHMRDGSTLLAGSASVLHAAGTSAPTVVVGDACAVASNTLAVDSTASMVVQWTSGAGTVSRTHSGVAGAVSYLPASAAASGSVGGNWPGPLTVTQVDGSGGSLPIGPAATLPFVPVTGPAACPVASPLNSIVTANATPTTILTFAVPDNTLADFALSLVGRNQANNGDGYRADLLFTYARNGGAAPALVGTAPSAQNVRSGGGGSTWAVSVSLSGNSVIVQVTGAAATNVHWTISGTVQQAVM